MENEIQKNVRNYSHYLMSFTSFVDSFLLFVLLPYSVIIRQKARRAGNKLKACTVDTAASFVIDLNGSKLKPSVLLVRVKTRILFGQILNRFYGVS